MKKYSILILVFGMILPIKLFAGWIITGRYIDTDGKTIMRRYFIEGNNIKYEQYNFIYSFNQETGRLILVDPENLLFVKTTLEEYRNKLMSLSQQRLNAALEEIPMDQRSLFETTYRNQARSKIYLTPSIDDSIRIIAMPDTIKLLGMSTYKYQLKESDRKKEEFFISPEKDCFAEFDMLKLLNVNYLLFPDDLSVFYQASERYQQLIKGNLVIKRIVFQNGFKTEWQVSKIEKKTIQEYEFGQPSLCKELTLDKWLNRAFEAENSYDDYE